MNLVATIKSRLLYLLFLLAFVTPVNMQAQDTDSASSFFFVDAEEDQENDVDADGQPVKKKKEVEINANFFISLGMNLLTAMLILVFIYYPNYKRLDTIFTFLIFNIIIFLLTYVLNTVKISMGAAFGLFAVFSMLRYRTTGISMKDMTYLFIFIALGLLSAIHMKYYELSIVCGLIFFATLVLDTKLILKHEISKILRFDNVDLITPDKNEELIEELKKRTGLNIHRVSVGDIDYLRDTCIVTIFYYD